jgi:hypothetical protein
MTEPKPITLNLTLKELQQIDKFVEINDDTLSVLTKIKDAYPQPKMHLENEGEFSIVSYDGNVYYRLQFPDGFCDWYRRTMIDRTLGYVEDIKTKNELESQWLMNDVKYQKDDEPYCPDEPSWYDEVESDIDENKKKPKTLRSIIDRWWTDTFTTHSKWDAEECMDDLADQIEFFYMRNKK